MENDRQRVHAELIRYGPYSEPSDETIAHLREEARAAAEAKNRFVISHERLSGYPATGGFDAKAIADRLNNIFPRAKILIMVREQKTMIRSFYFQYISDGGSLSFKKLLKSPQPSLHRVPGFDLSFFEYDQAVAYYQQVFGRDNILVLPFEQISRDARDLAAKIIEFAGNATAKNNIDDSIFEKKVNPAVPVLGQHLRRTCNFLLARTQLSNHGILNIPYVDATFKMLRPALAPLKVFDTTLGRKLNDQIEAATEGRYAESNNRLAEMTGLDLGALGYQI
jgi:hypothetical protein